MEVSKNSWHYKVLTERFCFMKGWCESDISASLCAYFWQVVFRLFLGAGLGLLVLSPLYTWTLVILGLDLSVSGILGALVVVMGIFVTFVATLVVVVFVITYIGDFIISKLARKKYKEKEPNLVVEYLKAKKNKVCPIIEFVEEE